MLIERCHCGNQGWALGAETFSTQAVIHAFIRMEQLGVISIAGAQKAIQMYAITCVSVLAESCANPDLRFPKPVWLLVRVRLLVLHEQIRSRTDKWIVMGNTFVMCLQSGPRLRPAASEWFVLYQAIEVDTGAVAATVEFHKDFLWFRVWILFNKEMSATILV